MGKNISDDASALVTSPKSAVTDAKTATAMQNKGVAAVELPDTTTESRGLFVAGMKSRDTEHAPTADSIRQGILQVSRLNSCWQDILTFCLYLSCMT